MGADRPRVLVAEDEEMVMAWLRRALEHGGMDVIEAHNGREAAELLMEQPVDLVLTDLWMPEMNGVELIESMDAADWPAAGEGRLPEIVVLSAHITDSSTGKLKELGVYSSLTKPTDVETLLDVVKKGLGSDRRVRLGRERSARDDRPGATENERATVLVADDDRVVRTMLAKTLTVNGYDVVEAADGVEAVEKALANHIDLIIMDLNMPRMSGREAVKNLRRATRDCFIICVTGECARSELKAVEREGAMSSFQKPFDLEALMAEVRRLDLIASHRRKLVGREKARVEAESQMKLSDKAKVWVKEQDHRYSGRYRLAVGVAVAAVVIACIAVPIVTAWVRGAAESAAAAAKRVDDATGAAIRMEGYLQRDEQRELHPRP